MSRCWPFGPQKEYGSENADVGASHSSGFEGTRVFLPPFTAQVHQPPRDNADRKGYYGESDKEKKRVRRLERKKARERVTTMAEHLAAGRMRDDA
jgi:hypothetical protein